MSRAQHPAKLAGPIAVCSTPASLARWVASNCVRYEAPGGQKSKECKALADALGDGMALKRLAGVLLQRLAPVYVATALWCVTGYFVFMIGGAVLTIALEITWPLLRPLFEVLYEELMTQQVQAQAQRRTALLKTFLPFFQAYKTVLTA